MRWVGIDEAGYGPNLGPLVMTAVIAEGPGDRAPDLWSDLAATIARAGSSCGRLWVDDSKAILKGGKGRDRLEAACLAAVAAARQAAPSSFLSLLDAIGAGGFPDVELTMWLEADDPPWPRPESLELIARCGALRSFEGAAWRIVAIRSVVVGPARFNAGLHTSGSKATVHFGAFSELLLAIWERAGDGATTQVRGDKHGGRHFYYEQLMRLFEDVWIDRGPEGPELSQYAIRDQGRRLELSLVPRADATDGLVALASIVSKAVREAWMDVFNAYWTARIPGLRPTAGYPGDSTRFRGVIEAECLARGLELSQWWRAK